MEEMFLKGIIVQFLVKELEIWKKGKKAYNDLYEEIERNRKTLDKYLLMAKGQKVNSHNLINFYDKQINKIIISVIESTSTKEEFYIRLKEYKLAVSKNRHNTIEIVKKCSNYLSDVYNKKVELSKFEEVSNIKNIISSIINDTYYKDEEQFKNLINKIKSGKYDTLCNGIIEYIENKRKAYLQELQNKAELKRKMLIDNNSKKLDTKKEIIKTEKKEKYQFDKNLFFNEDDNEILQITRKIVYENKHLIEGLNKQSYNYLYNCFKYNSNNNLLDTKKIDNYRFSVIIYELNNLINKIDNLLKSILDNKLSYSQIKKLIPKKDKIMFQLNEAYNKWLEFNNNEKLENDVAKKDIIYINTLSGTPYFEINVLNSNSIPKECYSSFIRMLDKIEQGIITKNPAKDGKYNNCNGKLKNCILKKKDYKTRIQYVVFDNFVFIITGFIKNEWTNHNNQNLYKMDTIAYEQITNFFSLDDDSKNEIIKKNREIHNRIKNSLISEARGYKNDNLVKVKKKK